MHRLSAPKKHNLIVYILLGNGALKWIGESIKARQTQLAAAQHRD